MTFLKTALVLVLGTAVAYAATLGWDTEYQIDPRTGASSGPYEAWQVILLGAAVVALAAWAGWRGHFVAAIATIPLTLTVAFVVVALNTEDQDGLFMVGALFMAIGSFCAVALVSAIAHLVGSKRRAS